MATVSERIYYAVNAFKDNYGHIPVCIILSVPFYKALIAECSKVAGIEINVNAEGVIERKHLETFNGVDVVCTCRPNVMEVY